MSRITEVRSRVEKIEKTDRTAEEIGAELLKLTKADSLTDAEVQKKAELQQEYKEATDAAVAARRS